MKALSIIGMVGSLIGILVSIGVMDIGCWNTDYISQPGQDLGLISLLINLFFLAFSIVATVVSFKKKKVQQQSGQ